MRKMLSLALICVSIAFSTNQASAQAPGPGPRPGPQQQHRPAPHPAWVLPDPAPLARPAPPPAMQPLYQHPNWRTATPGDRDAMERATQDALERYRSGSVVNWFNPESGHGGSVIPVATWQMASGQYCRDYRQTITINGVTTEGYGSACRQLDGHWQAIS